MTETMNDEARALRLSAWVRGLSAGTPRRLGDAELIPVRFVKPPRTGMLLLAEAIASGALELRDRGADAGEFEAVNRGADPVLILEGEILPSLEPRSIAAGSILVPPLAVVVVAAAPADARSRKRARDLAPGTDDISPEDLAASAGRDGIPAAARGQVGLVALAGGRLVGLELAGHPSAWAAIAPWAVPAWAAAAAAAGERPFPRAVESPQEPGAWVDAVASAHVETRPARGLGREMSLRGGGIAGRALWYEGTPLHLVAHAV